MARKRMLDPNLFQSEDVAKLKVFSRYVFIGMISNADDEGKGRANPNYLKSVIFPYDDVRSAEVEKALSEIGQNTSVEIYLVEGQKYYKFKNWKKWQKVEKPSKSVIPEPFPERSPNTPRTFPDESRLREEKGKEENNIPPLGSPQGEEKPARFQKPSLEEVRSYCQETKSLVNPEKFWNHYESNGWKVGRVSMKDWRAALRRWESDEKAKSYPRQEIASRYREL